MLTVNKLLASGVKREQILWVNFDDERIVGMPTEELDEVLQAYREMYPEMNLKEVPQFRREPGRRGVRWRTPGHLFPGDRCGGPRLQGGL